MYRNRLYDWKTIVITWKNGNTTKEKNVSMHRIGDLRSSENVVKVDIVKDSLD